MKVNGDNSKRSEDEFNSQIRNIKRVAEIRWAEDGHKNTISSTSRFSNFISSVQKRTVIFAALELELPKHSTTTKTTVAARKTH